MTSQEIIDVEKAEITSEEATIEEALVAVTEEKSGETGTVTETEVVVVVAETGAAMTDKETVEEVEEETTTVDDLVMQITTFSGAAVMDIGIEMKETGDREMVVVVETTLKTNKASSPRVGVAEVVVKAGVMVLDGLGEGLKAISVSVETSFPVEVSITTVLQRGMEILKTQMLNKNRVVTSMDQTLFAVEASLEVVELLVVEASFVEQPQRALIPG